MKLGGSGLVPYLLLAFGAVIGVVVASDLGWMPSGSAGPDSPANGVVYPVATAPQQPVTGGTAKSFVEIAKTVKPAVVNIAASRSGKAGDGPQSSPFDDPFFRRFFGDEFFKRDQPHRERKERGQGSGVIVDPNGLIITNNHVVNKADDIRVILSDKREFKGKLIGTDTKTDVAIVKIEATGLSTIPLADSDQLEVGEFVLAVGSPFGLTQSVTMGIVSAVGRASMGIAEYEDFIQTDAAINPGNSGGALVNIRGELVGINTAIFSQSGGNMGIGFAVPSNLARSIMDQLVKNGKVVRGWLGVAIQELTPELASQFGLADT
ncbi:MAG TPA: trypsin-like peptidase domain-containing protein, partial [Nitrospira sp.]|nr:trypsin-like peptidase domain-containing protein [Nitrospira sp.]